LISLLLALLRRFQRDKSSSTAKDISPHRMAGFAPVNFGIVLQDPFLFTGRSKQISASAPPGMDLPHCRTGAGRRNRAWGIMRRRCRREWGQRKRARLPRFPSASASSSNFCPRAGPQSSLPGFWMSDFERDTNGAADSRALCRLLSRTNRAWSSRNRLTRFTCGSHPRVSFSQGPARAGAHPRSVPRATRNLLIVSISLPIQEQSSPPSGQPLVEPCATQPARPDPPPFRHAPTAPSSAC